MFYSSIGLLALMVLLIENQDILLRRRGAFESRAWSVYRHFLYAVLVYYVADISWGLFESLKIPQLIFLVTTLYFAAIAAGILFWTKYTILYLEEENAFTITFSPPSFPSAIIPKSRRAINLVRIRGNW